MGESKKRKPAPKRRPAGGASWFDRAIRRIFGTLFGVAVRMGLLGAAILAGAVVWFHSTLPPVEELLDGRARGSVTLLDRNGDVFAWRGAQYGGAIRPGEVSPHLVHAVLSAEDRRFYSHFGVDPRGLARAMLANLRAGRAVQGGSTITQQTAKNVFLTSERTLERKIMEIPLALAMELKYSKDEILAIYMNRVYLGAGAQGFEAAAQRYFAKSAKLVSPAEAAMLAGLLKAPSRLAPTSDIARAADRAALVLGAMLEEGYLTREQAARALAEPARLSEEAARRIGAHFADWVMESGPAYLTDGTTEDVSILTTFDPKAQAAAEAALAEVFATKVRPGSPAEAAIVVMDPSGAVRAMVGGRDDAANQFNRATQALRQTGSAFKPFVYAAALEAGLSPNDVMMDEPLTIRNWSPGNYSGEFAGPVTLDEALARSINTVAVRVSEAAGREAVRAMPARLGVSTPMAVGPAVALGVSEATLIDMTGAYAVFANRGRAATPYGIAEVRLRGEDTPILRQGPSSAQVLDADVAALVTGMMESVIERGTGRRAALPDRAAAGKTGTTQGARDAWFIGFTADYVVGVWMGKDDNATLAGVTGGGLPADIWRETMTRLSSGMPPRPLPARRPAPAAPPITVAQSGEPAAQPVRTDAQDDGGFFSNIFGAILEAGERADALRED